MLYNRCYQIYEATVREADIVLSKVRVSTANQRQQVDCLKGECFHITIFSRYFNWCREKRCCKRAAYRSRGVSAVQPHLNSIYYIYTGNINVFDNREWYPSSLSFCSSNFLPTVSLLSLWLAFPWHPSA